jgi:hypothetical protein
VPESRKSLEGEFSMRFAVLMLVALHLAAPSDMSGKWTITGDVVGNPVNLNCSIQQNAEGKIAGKCEVNGNPVEMAGDVKDTDFKFSFTAGGFTLTYTGMVEGDTVKGDIAVAGASGTFAGKRVKE